MVLRWVLRRAAIEIATNPRLQAKAVALARSHVKPRVSAAIRRARPGIEAIKRRIPTGEKPR
jgi:hypothetical protein